MKHKTKGSQAMPKNPSQRKNIVQPPEYWAAFQKQAAAEGKNLSEWIGECCVAFLPDADQSKLGDRPPAHRPKKKDRK